MNELSDIERVVCNLVSTNKNTSDSESEEALEC